MKPNLTILELAYDLAQKAYDKDEVPVGAVIYHTESGEIITTTHNQTEQLKSPLGHAEIIAIQEACRKLKTKRLNGYSIFVTLEPCVMCAGALSMSHIDAVYFGAYDKKTGGICQGAQVFTHKQTHHKPIVEGGFNQEQNAQILTQFFKSKRK